MCRELRVNQSGYYAWLKQPISNHDQEDARLLRLVRASFVASHGIYGSLRVFLDLREAGESTRIAAKVCSVREAFPGFVASHAMFSQSGDALEVSVNTATE